jgi:hypothetical protein
MLVSDSGTFIVTPSAIALTIFVLIAIIGGAVGRALNIKIGSHKSNKLYLDVLISAILIALIIIGFVSKPEYVSNESGYKVVKSLIFKMATFGPTYTTFGTILVVIDSLVGATLLPLVILYAVRTYEANACKKIATIR